MNKKLSVTFFAILFSCVVVVPAISQELTNDVAILRGGWIPSYSVDFKEDTDWEFSGFAVMGEYNLNISPILLAFGIEYQRVVHEKDNNDDIDVTAGFLVPQIAAKFFVPGGFYIGAGLAGKYLISYDMEDLKTDKTIDLWLNGIVGFIAMISDGIYLDIMGRFGYNLTNNTWGKADDMEVDVDSAYDIAVYLGIGLKTFQTGL